MPYFKASELSSELHTYREFVYTETLDLKPYVYKGFISAIDHEPDGVYITFWKHRDHYNGETLADCLYLFPDDDIYLLERAS